MRDDDHAVAAFVVELEEEVDNPVTAGGVEVAGGFISEEERRVVAQGAGDGDALLFAAREFRGPMMQARAEADLVEQMRALGGIAMAGEPRGELDVLECGELGKKMIGLEDEANGEIAPRRELAARPAVDRRAFPTHFAGVGRLESAENLQQRAFAGAGRALDGVKSMRRKRSVEAAQDFEVGMAEAKRLVQCGAGEGR